MAGLEPAIITTVLIGAVILFVIGYIGNVLSFSNRFVNALVTAIVFAVIYAALYYVIDPAQLSEKVGPMTQEQYMMNVAVAAVLVFIIDLIANMISFSNRFGNALATAIVFAVVFFAFLYMTGGVPATVTSG